MSNPTLLIVDVEPFYISLLTDILGKQYTLLVSNCGQKALELIDNNQIDLILLDEMTLNKNGSEDCMILKSQVETQNIPVIFLTAKADIESEIQGFEAGSVDFITKPFSPFVVKSRVKTHLALAQAKQQLQDYSENLERLVSGRTLELTREIAEKQIAFEKLHYLANYDPLTQLPNRNLFNERLAYAYTQAKRNKSNIALLLIDLDKFKQLNDALGYLIGDELLKQCADRLSHCLKRADTIARLGDDEFMVLLTDIDDKQKCKDSAETIIAELSRPFTVQNHIIHISASIGITCYPEDSGELNDLLKDAEIAMYTAKENGKNCYAFLAKDHAQVSSICMEVEKDLYHAIANNELYLNYQPIVDLKHNTIIGVEALLRWHHSKHGQVPPEKIISIAEESDLILEIGSWVLKTACQQASVWKDKGYNNFHIAVNISPRQFHGEKDFVRLITHLLESNNLEGHHLSLELTESLMMEDSQTIVSALHQFKETGIRLSIDDFGTGYSSFNYLHRFPIDCLKIDHFFIQNLKLGNSHNALVKAIIALSQSLQLKVIAEGIETIEQLNFLSRHSCDFGQGYHFCKPCSAEEIEHKLAQQIQR